MSSGCGGKCACERQPTAVVPMRARVAPRMQSGARAEADGRAAASLVREAAEPDASTVRVRLNSPSCCATAFTLSALHPYSLHLVVCHS